MEQVRKSAEFQMGYYESVGRRSALALGELAIFIRHTDERMERIVAAGEATLAAVEESAATVTQQTQRSGERADLLLEQSTESVAALEHLVENPAWEGSLSNLEISTSNLATTTAHTAEATARASESLGYIRDMLSPTKKSFWRRLLELMIPRPTANVAR